jgi:uncharacterized membrane protein
VSVILIVVAPLVVFLGVLILRMNHAVHFAPQAYYRKKTAGAPIAYEFESLGPRPRKKLPVSQATADDGD